MHGELVDLVFDTSNSSSKLFLLYHHATVITLFFFSKYDHYIYIEISSQKFSFKSSLHNFKYLTFDERVIENL